ncbi:unnamed protein product [Discosporangium mesarthrocarpum]
MFVPAGAGGRLLWFNKDCDWADEEYGLVGLVVGLAVYSGVILDVPFPLAVFRKLLGLDLSLRDLADLDPELLQGLEKLRDYTGDDVEDVFCLSFQVTWDDLGFSRSYTLKPGGEEEPVTSASRGEYIHLYSRFILVDSVVRQFDCFNAGFYRVMGGSSISLLRAEELELLVSGTPQLNMRDLEEAAKYEGGFDSSHPTVQRFWEVVRGMSLEDQRNLLMFVTGSKRAPLGGLLHMHFKIQRAGPDTDQLPTAHTCFNTLMLPDYSSAEKLKRSLSIAITECEGFGLK